MRRGIPVLFCTLALLLLTAFQELQIRVEVEAVNVLVTVTNKRGQLVTDLAKDRFEIREDGAVQEITNFSHQTDLPLRIALLIDTSSSVRVKLDFEKQAATKFIYSVMRLADRALLVEFDSGVSLVHDFTRRPGDIAKAIKKLRAGGGTALMDALYAVSRDKMTEGEARQTIVLVSDGRDIDSRRTMEETLEMVDRSGVTIYAVGTNRFAADRYDKGEKLLRDLVAHTGGRAFFPYSVERLEDTFESINDELRSQYNLTYVPGNRHTEGQFRKIKVRLLNDKGLIIRYRRGYFSPAR